MLRTVLLSCMVMILLAVTALPGMSTVGTQNCSVYVPPVEVTDNGNGVECTWSGVATGNCLGSVKEWYGYNKCGSTGTWDECAMYNGIAGLEFPRKAQIDYSYVASQVGQLSIDCLWELAYFAASCYSVVPQCISCPTPVPCWCVSPESWAGCLPALWDWLTGTECNVSNMDLSCKSAVNCSPDIENGIVLSNTVKCCYWDVPLNGGEPDCMDPIP